MNPKDMITWLQKEQEIENKWKHSMAVKYIEENVDLIDTDLQKFMDDCPTSCQPEVYDMLLKAGIDMKDYVFDGSLKHWCNYIYGANPQFQQYYTIDYKQKMDEYIEKTVTWKPQYVFDSVVIDDIPVVTEA